MSASSSSKAVKLRSSDNEIIVVEEAAASMSETIKNMLNNKSNSKAACEDVVPVAEVDGKTMRKLMEWCRKHTEDVEEEEAEEVIKEWDSRFIRELEQRTLYKLVTAAYHLKVGELEELLIQRIADLLADFAEHHGFTIEQVDSVFQDDRSDTVSC